MSGYLYAVALVDGSIKVGKTIAALRERFNAHAKFARTHSTTVAMIYYTFCAFNLDAAEDMLIAKCKREAAARYRHEWFDGLSFVDVAQWVDDAALHDPATRPMLFKIDGDRLFAAPAQWPEDWVDLSDVIGAWAESWLRSAAMDRPVYNTEGVRIK